MTEGASGAAGAGDDEDMASAGSSVQTAESGAAPEVARAGAGVDRGDGRDVKGKFTGAGNFGADAEAAELKAYSEQYGVTVITSRVRATLPDGSMRYYDGLVEDANGTYTGLEVKSGSASVTKGQRAFDKQVLAGSPATAHLIGRQITITDVVLLHA